MSAGLLYLRRALAVIGIFGMLVVSSYTSVESSIENVVFATVVSAALAALPLLWMRDADPFGPLAYLSLGYIASDFGIFANLITSGSSALPHLPLSMAERARLGVQVLMLTGGWLFAYAIGFLFGTRKLDTTQHVEPERLRGWSPTRLWAVTVVCGLIFVVTYAEFQRRLGLPLFVFTALREGKAAWREDPTLSWMLRGVQIGFLPVLFWGSRVFLRGSRAQVAAVFGVALLLALLVNRLGQRSMGLAPLAALAGIFHYTRRRIPWSAIFVAVFAIVVYVNTTTRLRQNLDSDLETAMSRTSSSPLGAFSEHESERARLDSTAIILFFFPERVDYLWGESWAPVFTALVPRWIWPEKSQSYPYSDTRMLRTLVGLPAPTPIPALLYANFSWPGVPIGGALWGLVHAALYRWLIRNRNYEGAPVLYLLALVLFAPTGAGIASGLQYLVPAYLILRFIEVRLDVPDGSVGGGTRDEEGPERKDLQIPVQVGTNRVARVADDGLLVHVVAGVDERR